jgi:tetratricopeptide (TPR) repeat protein
MAEAYVLKGQTYDYSIAGWFASAEKREQIKDSIRSLTIRALAFDKSSADAYLLLSGLVQDRDSSQKYLEKALASNPNSFEVNAALGRFYIWSNGEKAIRFCKKAIRLNPLSIWTPDVYRTLGFIYMSFGDFEKAEFYGKKAIELAGNTMIAVDAKRSLTIIYSRWNKADSVIKYASQYLQGERNFLYELAELYCNLRNDCAKAAELYKELWNRYGTHNTINRWAVALLVSGNIKEGKEKLKLAFEDYKNRHDTLSYDYAGMCALNGDREKALSILKQCNWHVWGFAYLIQQDRMFDSIRNEKEFKEMLHKALDENTKLREKIKKLEEAGEL